MEEHKLRQRDLLSAFGSSGIAPEVVSGKRAISKTQAKKLAALFHVRAALFLKWPGYCVTISGDRGNANFRPTSSTTLICAT